MSDLAGMVEVRTAARLETLAEAFREERREGRTWHGVDTVLVTQPGWRGWLQRFLTERDGVCMNVEFVHPRRLFSQLLRGFFPHLPPEADDPFARPRLVWRIDQTLTDHHLSRFSAIANRQGPNQARQRFAIATELAGRLDDLLLYRPEVIASWEQGDDPDDWVAELWRLLMDDLGDFPHLARLQEALQQGAPAFAPTRHGGLPKRLFVFAPLRLAPHYADLLGRVAEALPVFLYRLTMEATDESPPPFTSLLKAGQHDLATTLDALPARTVVLHEPPPPTVTWLDVARRSLLEGGPVSPPRHPSSAEDNFTRSVQVHSAPGADREVASVHEAILDCFVREPTLRPEEILILAPEVDPYRPLLEGVFRQAETTGLPDLPLRVLSSRDDRAEAARDALLRLLNLPRLAGTADDLLPLLENPLVQESFGFREADLPRIESWLARAGVTSGPHERARQARGLEGELFTWRWMVDRLLLGLAMTATPDSIHAGLTPLDDLVDEEDIACGGRLDEFVGALERAWDLLSTAQPLRAWPAILGDLAETFLPRGSYPPELAQDLQRAAEVWPEAVYAAEILRLWVADHFPPGRPVASFAAGGIGVGAFREWAGTPSRVTVLLGLTEDALPEREFASSLDRLGARDQPGDPRPDLDDYTRFAQVLQNTTDHLILTYPSRASVGGSPLPPSRLLQQFLERIQPAVELRGERLVRAVPALACDPTLFDGVTLPRSFREEQLALLQAETQTDPAPFFPAGLRLEGRSAPQPLLTLAELTRFLRNPARTWLRERLGLAFEKDDPTTEEDEDLSLAGLDRYQLRQFLLPRFLAEGFPAFAHTHATGWLPASPLLATQLLRACQEEIRQLVGDWVHHREAIQHPIACFLPLPEGARLFGMTGWTVPPRQAIFLPSDDRLDRQLAAWLQHLFWCALEPSAERTTELRLIDRAWRFRPCPEARSLLCEVASLFREHQESPLPFVPSVAEKVLAKPESLESLSAKWDQAVSPGSADRDSYGRPLFDAETLLLYRERYPWDDETACRTVTERLLGPLLDHREAIS